MEPADDLRASANLKGDKQMPVGEGDFEGLVDDVAGQAWWALTGEQAVRAGEAGFLAMRKAIREALAGRLARLELPGLLAVSRAARAVSRKV